MKKHGIMKLCSVGLVVALAGSVSMADDHDWGRVERSYHGYHDSGRHYGYYRNPRGELVFGLLGIGIAAAVIASVSHPEPVVVQQPVYVQPEPQRVVYVQRPQVIQQPVVVQVEQPQPVTVAINIQNSNGSLSPVVLRQVRSQWVGPKGEYYDSMPTVGQLRPVYGF